MVKKGDLNGDNDDIEDDLKIEEADERVNDEIEENTGREPLFPFDKMPYQEKGENENELHEYEMGNDQELNLGESTERMKRRTLEEERGAGHEP